MPAIIIADPVPHDLAKASGFVNIDDLVSTEQLSTAKSTPEKPQLRQGSDNQKPGRLAMEQKEADKLNEQGQDTKQTEGNNEVDESCANIAGNDASCDDFIESSDRKNTVENVDGHTAEKGGLYKVPDPSDEIEILRKDRTKSPQPVCAQALLSSLQSYKTNPENMKQISPTSKQGKEPLRQEKEELAMAHLLDSLRLEEKKRECRMNGEQEVEGLELKESFVSAFGSIQRDEVTKRKQLDSKGDKDSELDIRDDLKTTERITGQRLGEKRLEKLDDSLGKEYLAMLTAKPGSSSSSGSSSGSSSASSSSSSGSDEEEQFHSSHLSRQETESDFLQIRERKKNFRRPRNNSHRRRPGQHAKDRTMLMYADDEESEVVGGAEGGVKVPAKASYPHMEWTPVSPKPIVHKSPSYKSASQKSPRHKPAPPKKLAGKTYNLENYDDEVEEEIYLAASQPQRSSNGYTAEEYAGQAEDAGYAEPASNASHMKEKNKRKTKATADCDVGNYDPNFAVHPPFTQPHYPYPPYPTSSQTFPPHPPVPPFPANPPSTNTQPHRSSVEYEHYLYSQYQAYAQHAEYYRRLYEYSRGMRMMSQLHRQQNDYIRIMAQHAAATDTQQQ